jgi:hypothetical protein
MKKLTTSILVVVLCLFFCFNFTACDTKNSNNDDKLTETVGEPITFDEGITAYRALEAYLNGSPIAPDSFTVSAEMNTYLPDASSSFYKSSTYYEAHALQFINNEYSAYIRKTNTLYNENGTKKDSSTDSIITICKTGEKYYKYESPAMEKNIIEADSLVVELQYNYDYFIAIDDLLPATEYLEEEFITEKGQECFSFTKKDNIYFVKIILNNIEQTTGTSDSNITISFNNKQVLTVTGNAEFKNDNNEIIKKMNVNCELKHTATITPPENIDDYNDGDGGFY